MAVCLRQTFFSSRASVRYGGLFFKPCFCKVRGPFFKPCFYKVRDLLRKSSFYKVQRSLLPRNLLGLTLFIHHVFFRRLSVAPDTKACLVHFSHGYHKDGNFILRNIKDFPGLIKIKVYHRAGIPFQILG